MIVYLARAIQAFVMYCVNGTSRSSLLIESTDSMIYNTCTPYPLAALTCVSDVMVAMGAFETSTLWESEGLVWYGIGNQKD